MRRKMIDLVACSCALLHLINYVVQMVTSWKYSVFDYFITYLAWFTSVLWEKNEKNNLIWNPNHVNYNYFSRASTHPQTQLFKSRHNILILVVGSSWIIETGFIKREMHLRSREKVSRNSGKFFSLFFSLFSFKLKSLHCDRI